MGDITLYNDQQKLAQVYTCWVMARRPETPSDEFIVLLEQVVGVDYADEVVNNFGNYIKALKNYDFILGNIPVSVNIALAKIASNIAQKLPLVVSRSLDTLTDKEITPNQAIKLLQALRGILTLLDPNMGKAIRLIVMQDREGAQQFLRRLLSTNTIDDSDVVIAETDDVC